MALRDELLGDIGDPDTITHLSRQERIPADLLTFSQHLPDLSPKFSYYMEWDNIAAVPVSTYEHWFKEQIHPNTRNKIRKAQKKGVTVRREFFTTKLAEGLVDIFNETSVRRGKPYSYFGKDIVTIEKEWSTDLERSDFLVAYYQNEIIGFIKILYSKEFVRTSGTVAKISHRDKAPMNALLAEAVKICAEKKIPFLVYGHYIYGKKGEDSLSKFKKNNGFQKIDIPKYYIPMSARGKFGLRLGLHRGIFNCLPSGIHRLLLRFRALWHERLVMKK